MTGLVRPTSKHINSEKLSLSQEHVKAFIAGYMKRLEVHHPDSGELLEFYQGRELERLMGSAIMNGRITSDRGDVYYLAER